LQKIPDKRCNNKAPVLQKYLLGVKILKDKYLCAAKSERCNFVKIRINLKIAA